jgi:archaellum component FlaC
MRVMAFLFLASLIISQTPVSLYSIDDTLLTEWAEKDIIVEIPLKLNVVFLGGDFTPSEEKLEEKVSQILPWYAPYILDEDNYLGVNITRIDVEVIKAPKQMVNEYVKFVQENDRKFYEPDAASLYISSLEERVQEYFLEEVGVSGIKVYWIDAYMMEEWLYENGLKYLGIDSDRSYTIYFLLSSLELPAVVEYFIDTYSPESGEYIFTGGMSAYGGNHRLYFIDLTSIPLGRDKCDGDPECKSATTDYYPTLWESWILDDVESLYNLLGTYIAETIIYLFFRGYTRRPSYEINMYNYLLIIDATEEDRAGEILKDFSPDYFMNALSSLIPYAYKITEYRIIDVDDFRELKNVLFATLTYLEDYVVVDCKQVPELVFDLPIIKRFKDVKTLVTVLFIFDEEAYVCRKHVVGRAFDKGALSAISWMTLEYEGPSLTLYHETSHVLGLRHPHDSDPIPWSNHLSNWFYDWSATPMTYDSACALRTMYEGKYFAKIDKDSIDVGLTIDLMRRARNIVYQALKSLEDAGLVREDIPDTFMEMLNGVASDLENAIEEFKNYNYLDWASFYGLGAQKVSAFDYAFSAYQQAVMLSRMIENLLYTLIEEKSLRIRLSEALKQLEELRARNNKLSEELEEIRKSFENVQKNYENLNKDYIDLQNKYNEVNNQLQSLKNKYTELQKEREQLKLEIEKLRGEISTISATNPILTSILIALTIAVATLLILYIKSRKAKPLPPPPPY